MIQNQFSVFFSNSSFTKKRRKSEFQLELAKKQIWSSYLISARFDGKSWFLVDFPWILSDYYSFSEIFSHFSIHDFPYKPFAEAPIAAVSVEVCADELLPVMMSSIPTHWPIVRVSAVRWGLLEARSTSTKESSSREACSRPEGGGGSFGLQRLENKGLMIKFPRSLTRKNVSTLEVRPVACLCWQERSSLITRLLFQSLSFQGVQNALLKPITLSLITPSSLTLCCTVVSSLIALMFGADELRSLG